MSLNYTKFGTRRQYRGESVDLSNYARKTELVGLIRKDELSNYTTKTDLNNNDLADRQYVDSRVDTRFPTRGGTITGDINLSNKKIANLAVGGNNDAVNKQYVDTQIATVTNNSLPIIFYTRVARILTRNSTSQLFRCDIRHNVFRNYSTRHISIIATTTYTNSIDLIVVPIVLNYEIRENELLWNVYLCNGFKGSPWPREASFDVNFQIIVFNPRPSFRSADNDFDVHISETVNEEAPINVETKTDVSEQNDNEQVPQRSSQRTPDRTNVANSYV